MLRIGFHTQEDRGTKLEGPISCIREDAWLGEGFYFWLDRRDAKVWGETSKNATKKYQIYTANINFENILDTVFNEEMYNFWLKNIEKAAEVMTERLKKKPSIKHINQYFKERAGWGTVDGIQFQDIPDTERGTRVKQFYYRKRIQIVVFNYNIIDNFALESTVRCSNP